MRRIVGTLVIAIGARYLWSGLPYWIGEDPDRESTSVNVSHDPILVASVWITSVIRPPPPTAVR